MVEIVPEVKPEVVPTAPSKLSTIKSMHFQPQDLTCLTTESTNKSKNVTVTTKAKRKKICELIARDVIVRMSKSPELEFLETPRRLLVVIKKTVSFYDILHGTTA